MAGSAANPLMINNAYDFARLAFVVNGGRLDTITGTPRRMVGWHFIVTDTIDLRGREWVAIDRFSGVFDGDSNTIYVPTVMRALNLAHGSIGLFTCNSGPNNTITTMVLRNIVLRGELLEFNTNTTADPLGNWLTNMNGYKTLFSVLLGGYYTSPFNLQSLVPRSRLENIASFVSVTLNQDMHLFGVINAVNWHIDIINAVNFGDVVINGSVGRGVGGISGGYIRGWNVANYGDITVNGSVNVGGTGTQGVAGITGEMWTAATGSHCILTNAYNRGNITLNGTGNAGGLLGSTSGNDGTAVMSPWPYIQNAYNTGTITAQESIRSGEIMGGGSYSVPINRRIWVAGFFGTDAANFGPSHRFGVSASPHGNGVIDPSTFMITSGQNAGEHLLSRLNSYRTQLPVPNPSYATPWILDGYGAPTFAFVQDFMPSDNANITDLVVRGGGADLVLSPSFSPTVFEYEVNETLPFSVATLSITATRVHNRSTVTVTNNSVPASSPANVLLVENDNVILVRITAEDGIVYNEYMIILNRTPASTNRNIDSLQLLAGALTSSPPISFSPAFSNALTVPMNADVENARNVVRILPVTYCDLAIVEFYALEGGTINATGVWNLIIGLNRVRVRVRAENRTLFNDFEMRVTRDDTEDLTDARLFGLDVLGPDNFPLILDPIFDRDIKNYNITVPYNVEEVTISANPGPANIDPYSDTGTLPLGVGGSTTSFTLLVWSQDGTNSVTYQIHIYREEASDDATLTSLEVRVGGGLQPMTPAFSPTELHYTVEPVANSVQQVTVNFTPALGATAIVEVMGGGGAFNPVTRAWTALGLGLNKLRIVVTAQDASTTREYIVELNRLAAAADSDASLFNIRIEGAMLDQQFASDLFEYTSSVGFSTEQIRFIITPTRAGASVSVSAIGGAVQVSHVSDLEWILAAGVDNIFTITVTSADGENTEVYEIIIYRSAAETDAFLTELRLTAAGGINETFDIENETNFTIAVPYRATVVTITASIHAFATTVGLGRHSGLAVGNTVIPIRIYAQDGSLAGEFFITVIRGDVGGGTGDPSVEVDKDALWAALEQVTIHMGVNATDYTAPSVSLINFWVEHGLVVFNDNDATQNAVDFATSELLAAFEARRAANAGAVSADKTALQALVNTVNEYLYDTDIVYTVASSAAVISALNLAGIILSSNQVSQAQVDSAYNRLLDAFSSLVECDGTGLPVGVNRDALWQLMQFVSAHMTNPINVGVYTPASEAAVQTALNSANSWFSNLAATQEQIDNALLLLESAFYSLQRLDTAGTVTGVDRDALTALLAQIATHLSEFGGNYTAGTISEVNAARIAANTILADRFATQAQIDTAYAVLRAAFEGLEVQEGREEENDDTFFTWHGFIAMLTFNPFNNFWPWLFYGGILLLLLLIIIIAVVATKKKRRAAANDGELDECRSKARDAINQAFSELRQAGELVTACDAAPNPALEQQAMLQLSKTDAAMSNAETCVAEFLKAKKLDKKKAK